MSRLREEQTARDEPLARRADRTAALPPKQPGTHLSSIIAKHGRDTTRDCVSGNREDRSGCCTTEFENEFSADQADID